MAKNLFLENKLKTALFLLPIILIPWILPLSKVQTDYFLINYYNLFGLGHFLLGFFFMYKSFQRDALPLKNQLVFIFLVLIITIAQISFFSSLFIPIFMHFYFILHGHLNEKTMFEKLNNSKQYSLLQNPALVALYLTYWLNLTYVIRYDQFINAQLKSSSLIYKMIEFSVEALPLIIIISGILILRNKIKNKDYKNIERNIIIHIIGIIGSFFIKKVDYLYVSTFVACYHFISWNIYSLQVAKLNGDKQKVRSLNKGIYSTHSIILILIVLQFYGPLAKHNNFFQFFFGVFFVFCAFAHITSSFYNESPVKKWFSSYS